MFKSYVVDALGEETGEVMMDIISRRVAAKRIAEAEGGPNTKKYKGKGKQ